MEMCVVVIKLFRSSEVFVYGNCLKRVVFFTDNTEINFVKRNNKVPPVRIETVQNLLHM